MPVPTPTMPGATGAELKYRARALAQLRILKQQMSIKPWIKCGTRTVDFGNGVECFCEIIFNWEAAYIRATAAEETVTSAIGLVFHPRSGNVVQCEYREYLSDEFGGVYYITHAVVGVAGGWNNGVTPLTTEYVFPLVDEDNATFKVQQQKDTLTGTFLGASGNYGNLCWVSGETVLSWRGTPTRHFRVPNNYEIPGLSRIETTLPSEIEHMPVFTVFGTALYQQGIVLAYAPTWNWPYEGGETRCFILGAARNSVDGKIYIVTQSDHYNAPDTALLGGVAHTLEKPGIFLTLWKTGTQRDGWDFVAEHNTGRVGLPWFGNSTGTVFVCSNGARLAATGVYTEATATTGEYAEEYFETNGNTGDTYWGFDAAYTGECYYEYRNKSVVGALVTMAASSRETAVGGAKGIETYTSDIAALYTREQAEDRVNHNITGGTADYIGELICLDGGETVLLNHWFQCYYHSSGWLAYYGYESYTETVYNDPPDGTHVVINWQYGYREEAGCANVAEFWLYGPATKLWGC